MTMSEWLKEYYSRVIEEYKFSMERKDRVTDWSIGIFFIALVAYVELLREQVPSIWRIYLIAGLLCFIARLFCSSCLAYAYLKKWRYLLDSIENHWMKETPSLDFIKAKIESLHYRPRTTERKMHFVKSQLLGGFLLLFLFPFFLLAFEVYSYHQNPYNLFMPITFLVGYYVYESVMFIKHEPLSMPKDNESVGEIMSEEPKVRTYTERFDEAFKTLLIVMTITFSGSIAFYKEIMEPRFFSYSVGIFAATIVLWTFSTLYGRKHEYLLKAGTWYLLMVTFGVLFARLHYTMFLLPPLVVSLVALVGLVLTLPILQYLRKTIGERNHKDFRRALLWATFLIIVLDVLYFFGLLTFPLL